MSGKILIGRLAVIIIPCAAMLAQVLCSRNVVDESRPLVALEPIVSPDGKSIAFSMYGTIWTLPMEGGEARELFHIPGEQSRPRWSPAGDGIAYVHSVSGQVSIRIFHLESERHETLRENVTRISGYAIAPDGETLIYASRDGLYRSTQENIDLIADITGTVLDLDVTNNGTAVTFSLYKWFDRQQTVGQVWQVDLLSGDRTLLMENLNLMYQLQWSPDGRYLAASMLNGNNNDLIVFPADVDAKAPLPENIRITSHKQDEFHPSWTPDQAELVFLSNRSGLPRLYRVNLETREEVMIPVTGYRWAVPSGSVTVQIWDAGTEQPLSGRIYVDAPDRKPYYPPQTYSRRNSFTRDYFFHQTAPIPVPLPAGEYTITATAGFEYKPKSIIVSVEDAGQQEIPVYLNRLTNLQEEGWYSGETHIHANYAHNGPYWIRPADVLMMIEAEDLNVGNVLAANSWGSAIMDKEHFSPAPLRHREKPYIVRSGAEFRSTSYGHMCLLGLGEWFDPMYTGFRLTDNAFDFPTNADIADSARRHGGMVTYAHPIHHTPDPFDHDYEALGIVMDMPGGGIDAYDLMSRGGDELNAMKFYHRLLNCGFRISAAAGTDVFLNRLNRGVPGGDRVYVLTEDPFTFDNWIEGLKKGRTFVTNNPLLDFKVNGQIPGSTISLPPGPAAIRIECTAVSTAPMREVRFYWNGRIIATVEPDSFSFEHQIDFEVKESGWVSVCVIGEADKLITDQYLFGYAGPVYIEYGSEPVTSVDDARYFLTWLDRFETLLIDRNQWAAPAQKRHVMQQLNQARRYYRRQVN